MEWDFSLQPLADSECVIMQSIDPGKGCSSLPPTFTFWEGGRTFRAGRRRALGGVESSVRQQPWSPSSLQIYLHPSSFNFGVPVPSSLPVLPNSRCVLLRQLLLPDSFPTALSVSQPLDSRLALVMLTAALRLSRWTPGPAAWVPRLVLPLASWENPAKLLTVPQALVSSSVKWE